MFLTCCPPPKGTFLFGWLQVCPRGRVPCASSKAKGQSEMPRSAVGRMVSFGSGVLNCQAFAARMRPGRSGVASRLSVLPWWPEMVMPRLLIKTLKVPRAPRITLGQPQLHTRQEGTWLLTDACPLFPPTYGPLWGAGGPCGTQSFGVTSTPLTRKYLLSTQMHLNERLRWKIRNLALFLPLLLLFWNLLLWTRSSWKGHAMGYGSTSMQGFSKHLLCQALGTEAPGDKQDGTFPLPSVPVSPPSTFSFHFI